MAKGIIEPVYDETDVYAIRALAEGTANQSQQLRAWQFIMTQACLINREPYRDVREMGGERDDVIYAEGRRGAGMFIVGMLSPEALEKGRTISAARRDAAERAEQPAPPARKRFTKRQA